MCDTIEKNALAFYHKNTTIDNDMNFPHFNGCIANYEKFIHSVFNEDTFLYLKKSENSDN